MKCRARELGFMNGSRVRPGAVFEAETCPKWADPAEAPAPVKPVEEPAPETFSELNKKEKRSSRKLWEHRQEPEADPTDLG